MPSSVKSVPLRGLALPALRIGGGYFAAKDKYDVAWGDLMVAIFTPIGGRPMNRQFGSALHTVLFEPGTASQEQIVTYVIRQAAARHCPHIIIESIRIARSDAATGLSLGVTFSLVEDKAFTQERTIFLDKTNITKLLQVA